MSDKAKLWEQVRGSKPSGVARHQHAHPRTLPLCVHEGPIVEACKTCNSGDRDVRICAHPRPSDEDRDLCTRVAVSAKAQACVACIDRKVASDPSSFVCRFDQYSLSPAVPGHRFNASAIEYHGRTLMAYRTGWAGSEVRVAELGKNFVPTGLDAKLNLTTPRSNYGREDPRLFVFNDQLHVAFVGVEGEGWSSGIRTNVLYAPLTPDLEVEKVIYPDYAKRQSWEKNWSVFEYDHHLFAVYLTGPKHQIVHIDGGKVELVAERPSFPWHGGQPRGGASPVRFGDEYWHFFHDRIVVRGVRTYRTGLYTFEASPPFKPRRYVKTPLLTAEISTKPTDQYASVVFPSGAFNRDLKWYVSHGVHDRHTEIHQWTHADLEDRLKPVN